MAQRGEDREFNKGLKHYFECETGAYSPVTWTEAKDGQITLTGLEKRIALDYFGEDELAPYRGNDKVLEAAGLDARRPFRIFPAGNFVYPKLKYAKASGKELRLYFNDNEFKVDVGHFWGIFIKANEIWLCQFTPWFEQDISTGFITGQEQSVALEPDTDDYQNAINGNAPAQVTSVAMSWKRNPKLAAQAMAQQNYQCEIMPELETFIARSRGNPFLEAHHLIPMKAQSVFKDKNLDTLDNICTLNPYAHRKIHHAPFDLILPDLKRLIAPRRKFLDHLEIGDDYIFKIYQSG